MMHSYTTTLALLFLLHSLTSADDFSDTHIRDNVFIDAITDSDCSNNQLVYTDELRTYCCPGAVYGSGDSKYCCVGADFEVPHVSYADCFPFCSGSSGDGVTVVPTTQESSCRATIPLTASDYSSRVQAAASLTSNGGLSNSGATTTGSGSGAASAAGGPSSSGSGSGSSGNAAPAMVTAGPVLGAAMAAGGLLVAAL